MCNITWSTKPEIYVINCTVVTGGPGHGGHTSGNLTKFARAVFEIYLSGHGRHTNMLIAILGTWPGGAVVRAFACDSSSTAGRSTAS